MGIILEIEVGRTLSLNEIYKLLGDFDFIKVDSPQFVDCNGVTRAVYSRIATVEQFKSLALNKQVYLYEVIPSDTTGVFVFRVCFILSTFMTAEAVMQPPGSWKAVVYVEVDKSIFTNLVSCYGDDNIAREIGKIVMASLNS